MLKIYEIHIIDRNRDLFPCRATLDTRKRGGWILAVASGLVNKDFLGMDLVDCLTKFRTEMESQGCLVVCNGTRKNAFISGMSRDIGGGRTCYLLELGKKFSPREMVLVLGSANPADVGTIEEQRAFYEKWRESVGWKTT
jgi:hypothetical protein